MRIIFAIQNKKLYTGSEKTGEYFKMNKPFLHIALIVAALLFCAPVSASEDSGDPFPDGFNFDDLSEADLPPVAEESPVVPPTKAPQPVPLSDDSPKPAIAPQKVPTVLPETRYQPAKGQVSGSNRTILSSSSSSQKNTAESGKTLTEALKKDSQTEKKPLEGTWIEKLTSVSPLSLLTGDDNDSDKKGSLAKETLENLVKNSRTKNENGKSNASVFDISGIMLRMGLSQTMRTLENRGFKKVAATFEVPNFIRWRNEERCREKGVIGYERTEACVIEQAKKEGHQYLQYLKYVKFESKEEIDIYFTSNFTENKVYKIVYISRIAAITGNSPKAVYLHNLKVYDFWKKINQKYGQPDNKTDVTWGLGGNKPYLKAATGYLLLEDPMFREMDYTRMSREDQRFIHSDFYNF